MNRTRPAARTVELLSLVREPSAVDLEVEELLSTQAPPEAVAPAPTWQEPRTARPPCDVPVLVRYGATVATAVFASALDAFGTAYIAGVRVVGVREPDMAQINAWMAIPGEALALPAEDIPASVPEVEVVVAELIDEDEEAEIEAERQRRRARDEDAAYYRRERERYEHVRERQQLAHYQTPQPTRSTVRVDTLGPPGPTFLTGGGWNQG